MLLKLKQSTPTFMIFGETGQYPITVLIKTKMLVFWYKLVSDKCNKISSHTYTLLYNMYKNGIHENKYLTCIKNILIEIGMPYLWLSQNVSHMSISCFRLKVKQALRDVFLQNWYSHIDNDSIYTNYRMFKTSFVQEPYISLLPSTCVITLIRFRTTNNPLPVNTLRYERIQRNERVCAKCNIRDIGDEYHYILVCPFFTPKRKECLSKVYQTNPNAIKYKMLLSNENKNVLLKLKHFISIIIKELQ